MLRFICHADGEDLTAKVTAMTGEDVEGALRQRTIRVVCSQSHPNIFGRFSDPDIPVADSLAVPHPETIDVPGRPPTPGEELLTGAVQRLAPESSIERLDGHAKFIFQSAATVGTLMTALGLLEITRPSMWIFLPVTLTALSLMCAAIALTPKYSTVEVSDLGRVRRYYVALLRERGGRVRLAGILFGFALLTAPLAFVGALTPAAVTSDSTFKVARSDDSDTASAAISLANVPPRSLVRAELFLDSQTTPFATYARRAGGDVKVNLEHPIPSAARVRVRTTVTRRGKEVYREETVANVPPLPPPKPEESEQEGEKKPTANKT